MIESKKINNTRKRPAMFKVQAEGFVTRNEKMNREKSVVIGDKSITYINTSIGSKYTNPHTKAESWDNLRLLLKGDIADSFKANVKPGDLVHIEGVLHEKSYKNEAGINVYYMECTVQSYRAIEIKKPIAKAANPMESLSKEFIATLSPEQLKALVGA